MGDRVEVRERCDRGGLTNPSVPDRRGPGGPGPHGGEEPESHAAAVANRGPREDAPRADRHPAAAAGRRPALPQAVPRLQGPAAAGALVHRRPAGLQVCAAPPAQPDRGKHATHRPRLIPLQIGDAADGGPASHPEQDHGAGEPLLDDGGTLAERRRAGAARRGRQG